MQEFCSKLIPWRYCELISCFYGISGFLNPKDTRVWIQISWSDSASSQQLISEIHVDVYSSRDSRQKIVIRHAECMKTGYRQFFVPVPVPSSGEFVIRHQPVYRMKILVTSSPLHNKYEKMDILLYKIPSIIWQHRILRFHKSRLGEMQVLDAAIASSTGR